MPPRETRHLVPVSANRHRAPPPPVRPRSIKEVQAARGIRAHPQARLRTLRDNLRRGARHRSQEPVQSALASHELQLPAGAILGQLIVAFRDPKNLIDRHNPLCDDSLLANHRRKGLTQSFAKPDGPRKYLLSGLWVAVRKHQQVRPPLPRHYARCLEKSDQLPPGGFARRYSRERRRVREVDGQAAAQQQSSSAGVRQLMFPHQ